MLAGAEPGDASASRWWSTARCIDMLDDEAGNGSRAVVTQLLDYGVRFIVCGQSAAARRGQGDLIPGVEIALSAMTAHAQLQQAGYTVNPF